MGCKIMPKVRYFSQNYIEGSLAMVDVNKKELGERIKKIRLELGDTTEVFGKRFDPQANRSLVSAWENGRYIPNPERLKSLAELGGISVDYLLNGKKDLLGNDMPVHDLSFYEYEILDATIEEPIAEGELILLFDLIKLTKGNDTLGCIVRSTCAFDDGKLSVVYFEDCSGRYDSDFFTKKISKGIAMDKIVKLNDYLTHRKYVAGFDDFTNKFYGDFKKHVIEYVSAYTGIILNEKDITFRFVNAMNKVCEV